MFQLTTGRFPQLESAFLQDILAQKNADPLAPLLVVSPSGQILNRLQRELAKSQAILNIHFLTFFALAERVLADAPITEGRVVTDSTLYREFIHDFLAGRSEVPFSSKDELLRSGPIPKGLAGALASTLKDLQDSGARVVDCANVVREGHLGDAAYGSVPILELNVLLYKALNDRGLRTSADRIRRAAERIPQSAWIQQQKGIYLYGFYDLTGVQLDLVNALGARPNAHIYFPYEADNPVYNYAGILLNDPAFSSKAVRRAMSDVKELRPGTSDVGRSVQAWSCSGTHDEAWRVAKSILELADQGIPYHEICVQARTLEPYQSVIREVFESHQIPFVLYAEEPVGAYPLIKRARTLINEARAESIDTWSNHTAWTLSMLANDIRLPQDTPPVERKLWEGLTSAIESLSELDIIGRSVDWERFKEVVNEKLEGLRLQMSPTDTAGVQVMDVMTARGLSFKAVFVVGLNEKLFPRLIREDPFLSDEARSRLAQALGCRLGRKMDGFQEEKLLFELATHMSTGPLQLSCQRSDEEGKALVISLYLNDYLNKSNVKLASLPRAWPEKIKAVEPNTLTPKEVSIAYHRLDQQPEGLYEALGWNQSLLSHLLISQKEIEAFGALGPHDGQIGPDDPLSATLLTKGLSPNTLKDLAECPFKVFSRKVLELYTEIGDVEEGQLTHTGRGKLIHTILQKFYESHSKISDLERIAKEEFRLFADEFSDLYPLVWEAEQAKILALLKRFIPLDQQNQAATGFKPTYFETPLAGEIAGIKMQGRMDRMDIGPAGFRVVDYKTGSGGIKKGESVETAIMKGQSFQLPIYLALAKTWLETQKVLPAGALAKAGSALFYRLQDESVIDEPLEIGADFWKAHGERFYENLAFLAKNIEAGAYYIRPSASRGYCSWCDYQSICRKEHKPTQIRSENSPMREKHESAFTPAK